MGVQELEIMEGNAINANRRINGITWVHILNWLITLLEYVWEFQSIEFMELTELMKFM